MNIRQGIERRPAVCDIGFRIVICRVPYIGTWTNASKIDIVDGMEVSYITARIADRFTKTGTDYEPITKIRSTACAIAQLEVSRDR